MIGSSGDPCGLVARKRKVPRLRANTVRSLGGCTCSRQAVPPTNMRRLTRVPGYNRDTLKRLIIIGAIVLLFAAAVEAASRSATAAQNAAGAQSASTTAQTVLILPFENTSKAPGLEWIGEAFPEVLGQRMGSPSVYVVPREDRTYAFERASIPTNLRPSRATLFRIGEQMDVDYMVLGHYTFDGEKFTGTAQLLDVKRLRLSQEMSESGPLMTLIDIQTALAWDVLRAMRPAFEITRNEFMAGSPPIRLDAFENYVRGITAATRQEKVARLREAIRLNPAYTLAILQLGRTYFAAREYESAAAWLNRVPHSDPAAREANFYAGLAYYTLGQYERAENAFSYVASQFPLTEVYNNLGVVDARRGRRTALDYFQKAVDADPTDEDYRFNLGVALYRTGDLSGAVRQLREAVNLRSTDGEARAMLDLASGRAADNGHRVPLERIKRNYDETSYRQLALEIQNAMEVRLAKSDPRSHAAYHVEHGETLLQQRFIGEAGREFREAITLDPTNAGAHAGLAAVLEASNDTASARKEAVMALQLQPSADAYLVLARLDLRDNNTQAAATNVEKALALQPTNAAAVALKRTVAAKMTEVKP